MSSIYSLDIFKDACEALKGKWVKIQIWRNNPKQPLCEKNIEAYVDSVDPIKTMEFYDGYRIGLKTQDGLLVFTLYKDYMIHPRLFAWHWGGNLWDEIGGVGSLTY